MFSGWKIIIEKFILNLFLHQILTYCALSYYWDVDYIVVLAIWTKGGLITFSIGDSNSWEMAKGS